jgi:hypothetical protein
MAGNELAASFNWTDDQLTYLSFSRNDKPIAFKEHEIDLTFKDPRQNGEIEKKSRRFSWILNTVQVMRAMLTSGSKQPSPHRYPIKK